LNHELKNGAYGLKSREIDVIEAEIQILKSRKLEIQRKYLNAFYFF
jgi:hypothetical protein